MRFKIVNDYYLMTITHMIDDIQKNGALYKIIYLSTADLTVQSCNIGHSTVWILEKGLCY